MKTALFYLPAINLEKLNQSVIKMNPLRLSKDAKTCFIKKSKLIGRLDMNIEDLNMTNAFTNYNAKNIVSTEKETKSLFIASLNHCVEDKSSIETNPSESKSSLKLHGSEDEVDQLSEPEFKSCSLCRSMLKDDGSCPICITPTLLYGNRQSHNPNVSQAEHIPSISKSSVASLLKTGLKTK